MKFLSERQRDPKAFIIQKIWSEECPSKETEIGIKDIISLLGRLNYNASSSTVKDKLKELKPEEENPKLDFEEFISLVRMLRLRTELEPVYSKYTLGKATMTPEELVNFLVNEQKQELSVGKNL